MDYLALQLAGTVGVLILEPLNQRVIDHFWGRTENDTAYGNVIWDVNKAFRVGFEVAWRETLFRDPTAPNNRGMFFHTQFAWSF